MMEALTNKPEVYALVEAPLLPVVARCCKQDGEEHFEEFVGQWNLHCA